MQLPPKVLKQMLAELGFGGEVYVDKANLARRVMAARALAQVKQNVYAPIRGGARVDRAGQVRWPQTAPTSASRSADTNTSANSCRVSAGQERTSATTAPPSPAHAPTVPMPAAPTPRTPKPRTPTPREPPSEADQKGTKSETNPSTKRPILPMCHLCSRQFGSSSLEIHGKPAPEAKKEAPVGKGLGSKVWAEFNEGQEDGWKATLESCPNCARAFLPDRLAVHLRSCAPKASTSRAVIPPTHDEIRAALSLFDTDNDGTLTVDEVVGIMTSSVTGSPMTMPEAQSFVDKFDHNGDGQLDLEEFSHAMTSMQTSKGQRAAGSSRTVRSESRNSRNYRVQV